MIRNWMEKYMKKTVYCALLLFLLSCVQKERTSEQNITESEVQDDHKESIMEIELKTENLSTEIIGAKLIKIIDVQATIPTIRRFISLLSNELIVVSSNPYDESVPMNRKYYFYDFSKNVSLGEIELSEVESSGFTLAEDNSILFYTFSTPDKYEDFSYSISSKRISPSTSDLFENNMRQKSLYEDFFHMTGKFKAHWKQLILNPYRPLRHYFQQDILDGSVYSIGLFDDSHNLVSTFPYIQIVGTGEYFLSPDESLIMVEAGFYRNDIFRDNPPPFMPKPDQYDTHSFSASSSDDYQYCAFIYQAVTKDNIEILDDPVVDFISFPTQKQIERGIEDINIHRFNGSHLNLYPGERSIWSTAIDLEEGTRLYRSPNLDSEVIKNVEMNDFHEIIVRKSEEQETIEDITDFWYLVEDTSGERGWVFGDRQFEIVTEKPIHLR